jgi:hypothetical protein
MCHHYQASHWVIILAPSQYNTLSFCNFELSSGASGSTTGTSSSVVQVTSDANIVGYHVIRYNSFQNSNGAGGDNGNEPIRLGMTFVTSYFDYQNIISCVSIICLYIFFQPGD